MATSTDRVTGHREGSARQVPPRRPERRRRRRREWTQALPFLLPVLVALLLLRLWPLGRAVLTSLEVTREDGSTGLGWDNFAFLLGDPGFRRMVGVTALFAAIVNPLQVLLALGLAVLLTQRLRGAAVWRTLVFLPAAVPQAVSAIVWGVAMRPDGPLNGLLAIFGIGPQPFLSSKDQALASIIVIVSWIGVGYWMMFLIAGLLDIPPSHAEAAAIDGAGWWATFWHVTLPQLRRPLAFVLVADTVANFLVFAPVQILTRGGPEGSTNLIMFEIYNQAYQVGDLSLAAAETVLLVGVVVLIVCVQFRLLPSKD